MIFFSDPILRAPLLASMLMCMASSLLSVLLFVRKKTLLSETLSHATFPGVVGGVCVALALSCEKWIPLFVLAGGFVTALFGALTVNLLKKKAHLREDAALCFVLASFFGIGVTLISRVQFLYPAHTRSIQGYLYGQVATMSDFHIVLYGGLALFIVGALLLFYKEFATSSFDPEFATVMGISGGKTEAFFFTLVVLAVILGIRCVGVVLMSAMLIAPGIAARKLAHQLKGMFLWAAGIGAFAAMAGCLCSFHLSTPLPTGPLIVLIAAGIAILALLLAPREGLLIRYLRIVVFRLQCAQENLLKALWRGKVTHFSEMKIASGLSFFPFLLILLFLRKKGWITFEKGKVTPSREGIARGGQIVRLHRLWEMYLVEYVGINKERVHASAEEMEHILTPQLEEELTLLLKDPQHDPHAQPIPQKRERSYG